MTPASTTSRLCAALLFGLCIVDEAAATSSRGVLAPPGIAPAIDLSPRTYELPGPLKPVAGGRLRAITADLTRRGAVRRIAGVARRFGVAMRVVYLSNAEEYWERLPDEFRDNLAALPVDERSVVLRTLLTWEHNRDYRYNAQPLPNYRRWLAHASVRTIHDVVRLDRLAADARGFFEVHELPDLALLQRRELRRRRLEAAAAATAAAP